MPLFHLKTNVPVEGAALTELQNALTKMLAETSTKPEKVCQVVVEVLPMTFGGTTEPTAYADYICIGVIGGAVNEGITAKFAALIDSSLNVPIDRFYIKFYNVAPSDLGLYGSTRAAAYS